LPERARVGCSGPHAKDRRLTGANNSSPGKNVFLALDRGFRSLRKIALEAAGQRALREAKSWMLNHIERTEGLAAIYPAR